MLIGKGWRFASILIYKKVIRGRGKIVNNPTSSLYDRRCSANSGGPGQWWAIVRFTVCTNSCIDVGKTTTIWLTKSGSVNSQTAPILGVATGLGQCYRYLTMSLCIRAQRNLSSVVKFVGNTTRSVLTLSDLSEETSPICISRKQSMMGNHRLDLRTSTRGCNRSKRELPLTDGAKANYQTHEVPYTPAINTVSHKSRTFHTFLEVETTVWQELKETQCYPTSCLLIRALPVD